MSEFNAQTIRAIADEFGELQAVAEAAERFIQRIGGFRIVDTASGQTRDVMLDDIPEARALKAALKAWRMI